MKAAGSDIRTASTNFHLSDYLECCERGTRLPSDSPTEHRLFERFDGHPAVQCRQFPVCYHRNRRCRERPTPFRRRRKPAAWPPEQPASTQEQPTSLAVSADHRHLAVGTAKGTVAVWNIARGTRSALYRRVHEHVTRFARRACATFVRYLISSSAR